MDDNLSFSERIKERYCRLYLGVFFQRFILGLWVLAEGIIFDMFSEEKHLFSEMPQRFDRYLIGIGFGRNNTTTFLLIGESNDNYYVLKEYFYNGREHSRQKTVSAYSKDLKDFMGDKYASIYVDSSPSPLIAQFEKDRIYPEHANNDVLDVLDGI